MLAQRRRRLCEERPVSSPYPTSVVDKRCAARRCCLVSSDAHGNAMRAAAENVVNRSPGFRIAHCASIDAALVLVGAASERSVL
jgi:hypothetical protein